MKKTIQLSGESGGGQILRSALSLSMVSGQPFRLTSIRGKRPKPGLMRQHLTCVNAAVQISQGSADGAAIGSRELIFHPGQIKAGDYQFAIGTAGSTTLLAQTLLPALWGAQGASTLVLEGGTHNPMAPTMDFIQRVFLPILNKMDVSLEGSLLRHGFAPAGGGMIRFEVAGGQAPCRLDLIEHGEERKRTIRCLGSRIPETVPGKETSRLARELGWEADCIEISDDLESDGPGNVLTAEIEYANLVEQVTSFGAFGKPGSRVALETAKMMKDYLGTGAVAGRRLADQLLLPMALGGGGSMLTMKPSNHVLTNLEIIQSFLPASVTTEEIRGGLWKIEVTP